MPDTFQPLSETKFIPIRWNDKYPLDVPDYNERHGGWKNWEWERTNSIENHLKPGMLFFDIGGYDGWQSAIFSRFVGGPENLVIVEPVPENWAAIKATFEANGIGVPRGTFMGFCDEHPVSHKGEHIHEGEWPDGPDYSRLIHQTKFKLIHEHAEHTAAVTIDMLSEEIGLPAAINIDVEGAELRVLKGAIKTLRTSQPLVWVSIHPQFMARGAEQRYTDEVQDIFGLMKHHGYGWPQFLAWDHEMHFLWKIGGFGQ